MGLMGSDETYTYELPSGLIVHDLYPDIFTKTVIALVSDTMDGPRRKIRLSPTHIERRDNVVRMEDYR